MLTNPCNNALTNCGRGVWRHVVWGVTLQFLFGLLILRWVGGKQGFRSPSRFRGVKLFDLQVACWQSSFWLPGQESLNLPWLHRCRQQLRLWLPCRSGLAFDIPPKTFNFSPKLFSFPKKSNFYVFLRNQSGLGQWMEQHWKWLTSSTATSTLSSCLRLSLIELASVNDTKLMLGDTK